MIGKKGKSEFVQSILSAKKQKVFDKMMGLDGGFDRSQRFSSKHRRCNSLDTNLGRNMVKSVSKFNFSV